MAGTVQENRFVPHCNANTGPCPLDVEYRWIFGLPLDGTAIMFRKDGLWESWIDVRPYVVTPGPC